MEYIFEVNKFEVYNEVAQTTSYTGAKMDNDPNAYERIFTTDEDQSQLDRFWDESCGTFCDAMKRYIVEDKDVRENPDEPAVGHEFMLSLSRSFNEALLPSMQKDLFSYFVASIIGKWYVITNKQEAAAYSEMAASWLEAIHRKACYKRKPTRPI